jgi:hypothetical protein
MKASVSRAGRHSGLKPRVFCTLRGTTEEAAENGPPTGSSRAEGREEKSIRKDLFGTDKSVPFQNTSRIEFFREL